MDIFPLGQFEVVANAFKVVDIASPINIILSPRDTVQYAHDEFLYAINNEMNDDWFALVKDDRKIYGFLAYDGEYFLEQDHIDCENDTLLSKVSEPITPEIIVPSTMPLLDLIPLFESSYFFFVLTRNTISHVVSFNDLEKHAVRLSIFSLLMELEASIIQLLLDSGNAESLYSLIKVERRNIIEKFIKPKYHHNSIEYKLLNTNFSDKGLMLRSYPDFADQMNFKTQNDCDEQFKVIKDVRNKIAHGDSFLQILDKPIKFNNFLSNLKKMIQVVSYLSESQEDAEENLSEL